MARERAAKASPSDRCHSACRPPCPPLPPAAGAAAIAALLRGRGVQLELVLDEGGLIMMDGIAGPSYTLVEQVRDSGDSTVLWRRRTAGRLGGPRWRRARSGDCSNCLPPARPPACLPVLPGLQPVALIGTAEKGYVTWEVEVEGSGGHSSMPPVDGSSGGWVAAARCARRGC